MSNSNNGVSPSYSKYGPHPVKKSSRTVGIVMTASAFIALIVSFFVWNAEKEKFRDLTTYFHPDYNFINPEEIGFELSLISVLQGGILIVLVLGIYRIIFSRKSTTNFAVLTSLVCMALTFLSVIPMQGTHQEVKQEILANQHIWAEKRYGIAYDEVTVREIENGKRDYKIQDQVILDGEVIASVCQRDSRRTVIFCETGTEIELPLISEMYDSEYSYDENPSDRYTYDEDSYDETSSY